MCEKIALGKSILVREINLLNAKKCVSSNLKILYHRTDIFMKKRMALIKLKICFFNKNLEIGKETFSEKFKLKRILWAASLYSIYKISKSVFLLFSQ